VGNKKAFCRLRPFAFNLFREGKMKLLTAVLLFTAFNAAYAADENGSGEDIYASTQTFSDEGEEAGQVMVQDSEEDVLNFVEDYIKKDISLKGSFLIEDKAGKQVLRLKFLRLKKEVWTEEAARIAAAEFKDSDSRTYEVQFHVTGINWGNLDINKLVLKKTETKNGEPAKKPGKEDKKADKKKT